MIAHQVAAKIDDKVVGLDLTMIATIISIIAAVFEMWQKCKATPSTEMDVLRRWHLRKIIRAKINDEEMHEHVGHQIYTALTELLPEDVTHEYNMYTANPHSWGKDAVTR